MEPDPGARQLAGLHLERPHVRERRARIGAERARRRVPRRQNGGVQHRLGSTRLARLRHTRRLVRIIRRDLVPLPHTFQYVFHESCFGRRSLPFAEPMREGAVGQARTAASYDTNAEGAVITLGRREVRPPALPFVQAPAAALRFQDGASAAVNIDGSATPIRQAEAVALAAVILRIIDLDGDCRIRMTRWARYFVAPCLGTT